MSVKRLHIGWCAYTCPTAPTHPRVTAPHWLISGLVNYLINGLPGQANLDRTLKGQFSGQAHAAIGVPTAGEALIPSYHNWPMPRLSEGVAEPAAGFKASIYQQLPHLLPIPSTSLFACD